MVGYCGQIPSLPGPVIAPTGRAVRPLRGSPWRVGSELAHLRPAVNVDLLTKVLLTALSLLLLGGWACADGEAGAAHAAELRRRRPSGAREGGLRKFGLPLKSRRTKRIQALGLFLRSGIRLRLDRQGRPGPPRLSSRAGPEPRPPEADAAVRPRGRRALWHRLKRLPDAPAMDRTGHGLPAPGRGGSRNNLGR